LTLSRKNRRPRFAVLLAVWLAVWLVGCAAADDAAFNEAFEAAVEAEQALRERALAVNEGELRFLPGLLGEAGQHLHHHSNRITVTQQSLRDGWVLLQQCHENLDPVGGLQIVFNEGRSRGLEITTKRAIAEAWVEGVSVQLRDIAEDSRICLQLQSRALSTDGTGGYVLQNGPYMRRFLDGYYPMRVSQHIVYPRGLEVGRILPDPQAGMRVTTAPGAIDVETVFEGRLITRFEFLPARAGPR